VKIWVNLFLPNARTWEDYLYIDVRVDATENLPVFHGDVSSSFRCGADGIILIFASETAILRSVSSLLMAVSRILR
jgi:hypothetical protein